MSDTIKNLMDLAEMPKDGILSISVEDNEYVKVVLFMMPSGQYLSPHTSVMAATIQVLSGEAEFTLGEETHSVKALDHFFMPPNYNHAIKATQDFVFLLTLHRASK